MMSQRDSGYERKERDLYETPEWVTEALLPHLPVSDISVWEPACGSGKMSRVLARRARDIIATDIFDDENQPLDFLQADLPESYLNAIITNPPYVLASQFIWHALDLMGPPVRGIVAMLLRTDFDHAATRSDMFVEPPFAKKVVLTKRIKWFEDSKGSPSFNHAWFIWDWKHQGPPTLAYGP